MKERSPGGFRSRRIVGRLIREKESEREREKTDHCRSAFFEIWKSVKKEKREKIARDTFEP
jgi:hypothetical protein